MMTWTRLMPVFCLLSLLNAACEQKKPVASAPEVAVKPALATLSKSTVSLGDSISIQLSQPLTQVAIFWDGQLSLSKPIAKDSLRLASVGKSIGRHQLVVQGLTVGSGQNSDTLTVELWPASKPTLLTYSVLETYPHQTSSFTQGFEFDKEALYEGTGLNGQSKLMKVDLKTGISSKSVALPNQYFGEGITLVNNHIYQLTWTSGQCFRYTKELVLDNTFTYHTQGWGLTHQDTTLIMSDGSNKLIFYTPGFQRKGEIAVYDNNGPVVNLNELEYVNGYVLANVWQTNRIVQIDLSTGQVIGELRLDAILPTGIDPKENVLNGIAYRPDERALYVTGKNWPSLFKLQVAALQKASRSGTL